MVKNASHTLAYSLIALQEMNLAFKFPIVFWNCACLINDAGGDDSEDEEENYESVASSNEPTYNEMEEFLPDDNEEDIEDSYEEIDCDGYPAEVVVLKDGKKKKKIKATSYGKIAAAIGRMKMAGVDIEPPNINKSSYTFSPDPELNIIRHGMSGITRITAPFIKQIISNRPYQSLEDFIEKNNPNKLQMINLIKSGAFDCFKDRIKIMRQYIEMISGVKKRITLQNMKMLIDFELIPQEYDLQRRVFNFNKYIKKLKLDSTYYGIDNIALNFLSTYFDINNLIPTNETESGFKIKQSIWDNIYQKQMDIIRPFIKEHQQELLTAVNNRLIKDLWEKYCQGNISQWEMESMSYYSHPHELADIDMSIYLIEDFNNLSPQADIDRTFFIKGKEVPIFKLHRIAGTVLDRDKNKKIVTLLTTTGVVTVKVFGGVFEMYDRQISQRGADGKKHVVEKSIFTKGNKIIVTGIRSDESFLAKTYKSTPWHRIEQIVDIKDNRLVIKTERAGEESSQ